MNDSEKQTIVFIPRTSSKKEPSWAVCLKSAMPLKEAS